MKGMWLIQGKTRVNLAEVRAITSTREGGTDKLYFNLGGSWGPTIDPAKPVQIVSDERMLQLLRSELIVESPPAP